MDEAGMLERIVANLKEVAGIRAIVLGGSRATGTHTPASDYDIGLFYRGEKPFDLEALSRVASRLDDERRKDLVTPIGGWGPWVVGGGWLKIASTPVDFIYRDLERVASVIADCARGVVDICYQPAYTTGYVTATYMAEIDACRPLWDPAGEIAALKALTRPYPAPLKQALIGQFGWVPSFALLAGRKCAARGDVAFAANMSYWATAALCQLLFALNDEYCLNEKGGVARVETFSLKPPAFKARIDQAFALLRAEPEAIERAFDVLASVVADTERLLAD